MNDEENANNEICKAIERQKLTLNRIAYFPTKGGWHWYRTAQDGAKEGWTPCASFQEAATLVIVSIDTAPYPKLVPIIFKNQ